MSVVDARGRALPAPGLAAWLKRVAPARVAGEVTIAVVPDPRSRTLNHTYRGKDAATDVLSFPGGPAAGSPKPVAFLGDIVIARGVARRQAREAGHSESTEWRVLDVETLHAPTPAQLNSPAGVCIVELLRQPNMPLRVDELLGKALLNYPFALQAASIPILDPEMLLGG